ncbi:MAG: nucleotide-binding protein [Caulobacteraceae bacterium]
MPVIALASSKGGCGKSTATLILAGAYASDGYAVHIIDADRSGRLFKWAKHGSKPDNITASRADEKNLRSEIDQARKSAEVVLIDVEGSANATVAFAVGYADAVIVPANPSAPDVEDAISTVSLVRDMAEVARRPIPHALLWSRVPTAIKSREMTELENQIGQAKIPVIGRIHERTAYKSLFSFATTLDHLPASEVPGVDKAKKEAAAFATAVVELIRLSKLDPKEIAA